MNETFQGKCPQCGFQEGKPTVKQLNNVMNTYTCTRLGKKETAHMNRTDDTFTDTSGCVWTRQLNEHEKRVINLRPAVTEKVVGVAVPEESDVLVEGQHLSGVAVSEKDSLVKGPTVAVNANNRLNTSGNVNTQYEGIKTVGVTTPVQTVGNVTTNPSGPALAGLGSTIVEPAGNEVTGVAKGAVVVKDGTPITKHSV